jgi:hypothetical protein
VEDVLSAIPLRMTHVARSASSEVQTETEMYLLDVDLQDLYWSGEDGLAHTYGRKEGKKVTVLRLWAHLAQVSRLWRPREVMETWTFYTYKEVEGEGKMV